MSSSTLLVCLAAIGASTLSVGQPTVPGTFLTNHVQTISRDTIPELEPLGSNNISLLTVTPDYNPLPIDWLGFHVSGSPTGVLLNWSTTTDGMTATFAIQRSSDGRNWDSIGAVAALPGKMEQLYAYTDILPLNGSNYYRLLRETGIDTPQYSPVEAINCVEQKAYLVNPNPVRNTLNLSLLSPKDHTVEILLLSTDGKTLRQEQVSATTGLQKLEIDVNGITPGIYLLDVVDENGPHPQKVAIL
jgi:hypothetical protein